jgi:hypothetical protein
MVESLSKKNLESNPVPIPHQNSGWQYRHNHHTGSSIFPEGWTKHKIDVLDYQQQEVSTATSPSKYYFQHKSVPNTHFWYPIPPQISPKEAKSASWARLLHDRTRSTTLHVFWRIGLLVVDISFSDGLWAGILHDLSRSHAIPSGPVKTLERLIAMS